MFRPDKLWNLKFQCNYIKVGNKPLLAPTVAFDGMCDVYILVYIMCMYLVCVTNTIHMIFCSCLYGWKIYRKTVKDFFQSRLFQLHTVKHVRIKVILHKSRDELFLWNRFRLVLGLLEVLKISGPNLIFANFESSFFLMFLGGGFLI